MMTEQRIVTNRVFMLGLDDLYREAMKRHESGELLGCAEETATVLSVEPEDVPIEGYYTESPELTRYFLLMRALQQVSKDREPEVIGNNSYTRLKRVTSSPIFGEPEDVSALLPACKDALTLALEQTFPDWTVPQITAAAYEIAVGSDDYSLVTLSSLTKDPVVLTACRESVVLYADLCVEIEDRPEPEYVWRVDEILEQRAGAFVAAFNDLMGESLPEPCSANAQVYFDAFGNACIDGRCVRIGSDERVIPARHYHWAIDFKQGEGHVVKDFWDTELWTTQRYRGQQGSEL
jgi:hypothetical protein